MTNRQSGRRIAAVTGAVLETLERRRLLSATLVDGVLFVTGTSGGDEIHVGSDYDEHVLFVNVNKAVQKFHRDAVLEIRVDCGDGDVWDAVAA